MGHAEFLNSQKAHAKSRTKRKKAIRTQRRINKGCAGIEFIIVSAITSFCFYANIGLGAVIFVLMLLPSLIDIAHGTITDPPFTTVKGEDDCPKCNGRYFIHQGIWTYWIGWKECNCQPRRDFTNPKGVTNEQSTNSRN
jgi:hypothetical protein